MSDVSDCKSWFKEDITNVLVGVLSASQSANGNNEDTGYRAGFNAALRSIALVVGVSLDELFGAPPTLIDARSIVVNQESGW